MSQAPSDKLSFDYSLPKTLQVNLSGEWSISSSTPSLDEVAAQFTAHSDITRVTFNASQLSKWDSSLVSFLLRLIRDSGHKNIQVVTEGLPQGAQKLLLLALKTNEKIPLQKAVKEDFFERVGSLSLNIVEGCCSFLTFLGEIAFAFGRMISGKAYFNRQEFVYIVQRCGYDALPLVSLISMLVGVILAFVGVIQLRIFGAQIFIADIVGIAMVRVMGAVMTGVLLAGRTGASFAAELGIMQTNEEIDALKTLGINPVEYLVMPRVLALIIMMPLLTIYADFMGIVGGFIISAGILNINPVEYLQHTKDAVKLNNLWVGLVQGLVFGVIVAVVGCLRGIKSERNSVSVAEATTSAVVSAITGIVIATAIITFICQVLGV